jgi:hypothetical protein
MTEPLTNDTVIMLAVIALVAICVIAWNLRWAFERPVEVDEDELADRIETAIGDATRDLLGVLEEIRDSNQAILDDSDEAPGTSSHGLMNSWGRPRGFRPAETTPPYAYVDLRKHD